MQAGRHIAGQKGTAISVDRRVPLWDALREKTNVWIAAAKDFRVKLPYAVGDHQGKSPCSFAKLPVGPSPSSSAYLIATTAASSGVRSPTKLVASVAV